MVDDRKSPTGDDCGESVNGDDARSGGRLARRGVVAMLGAMAAGGLAVSGYEAFFRCGTFVPLRVAGASMAPTLTGAHFDVACPACGRCFTLDAEPISHGAMWSGMIGPDTEDSSLMDSAMPYADAVRCGGCGERVTGIADRQRTPVRPGQRVILDRMAFRTNGPRRFEIVALAYPGEAMNGVDKFCVKRVVGLPGERIQFMDGRLHINGREYTPTPEERRRIPRIAVPQFPLVMDRGVTDEIEYLRSHGPRVACDVVPVPPDLLWSDSSGGGGVYRQLVFREPVGWWRTSGFREAVLPDNEEYFVVGDNMTLSEDSRVWGPVHRQALRGRVMPY